MISKYDLAAKTSEIIWYLLPSPQSSPSTRERRKWSEYLCTCPLFQHHPKELVDWTLSLSKGRGQGEGLLLKISPHFLLQFLSE